VSVDPKEHHHVTHVGNKGSDGVERLPEGHDSTTDVGRGEFTNVDGTRSQSNTLANTDEETTNQEDDELVVRRECLHECSDNDEATTDAHAGTTTEAIGDRSPEEEPRNNSSNSVGSVDRTDLLRVRLVVVSDPVLGALDGIVN